MPDAASPSPDAATFGIDASGPTDASPTDASPTDASPTDASPTDAAAPDGAAVDAGCTALPEICDGLDNDCNGLVDDGGAWSNVGDPCSVGTGACERGGVFVCDAADRSGPAVCSVTPGAAGTEVCDYIDNDCNGTPDDGGTWSDLFAPCSAGTGTCERFGVRVCDSSDPSGPTVCSAVPAAEGPESCNLLDDDCDGVVDNGFSDLGVICTVGVGACASVGTVVCTFDGTGTECSATPGSGTSETCNGLDDDCDGSPDNGVTGPACPLTLGVCAGSVKPCGGTAGFLDCSPLDYGSAYELFETSCDGLDNDCNGSVDDVDLDGDGHVAVACGGDDCDDTRALVFTGHSELCGDALDNDCNGIADDKDADGDLHVDALCSAGYTGPLPDDDCNDDEGSIHPGLAEACGDGLDNDCDSFADNLDADGDFWIAIACGGNDCDDGDADAHPGMLEICDGKDNDCTGAVDDKDSDVDGHVDVACTFYSGGLPIDDCDDDNTGVHPGRSEVCGNSLDEDCSGILDDRDRDRDGFFDDDPVCGGADCDDTHPLVYPGAPEVRDGLRNDCSTGEPDSGLLLSGDLVITELLYDSSGIPDESHEWFEVFNPTARPIDLRGWLLYDAPSSVQELTSLLASTVVGPRKFAVLCANTNPLSNGGVICDTGYGYLTLANTADEIFLEATSVVVDQVEYDEATWPAATSGSLNLDPGSFASDNNSPAAWCNHPAGPALANGDEATPGVSNVPCLGPTDPAVVATDPDNGIPGSTIRIVGSGFSGASSVSTGGTPCASFGVVSNNEILCTVGAVSAGVFDVTVVNGVSSVLPGALTVTREASAGSELVDAAQTLFPANTSFDRTAHSEALYASATVAGVTGSACPASRELPALIAEVGIGPAATDPRTDGAWRWSPAFCDGAAGGATQFVGTVTASSPGSYSACYRFSLDGGLSWNYADLDGTGSGFSVGQLIDVTVN